MIYIGLDDTDIKGSRGTGRLARTMVGILSEHFNIFGITRHQLLFDPRVPYTSKNSSATIHLQENGSVNLEALADRIEALMRSDWFEGSDPGLCVTRDIHPSMADFGSRVKTELVTQPEAREVAQASGCILRGLGGTCDGIIGALASVGLAATGNDGRFILAGSMRDLSGLHRIDSILASGIAEVRSLEGQVIEEGIVETGRKLRPALREGRPILFVEQDDTNQKHWVPVKLD